LVVSGINHGANLSTDVFYSGTVAIAREAALRGVPGIAMSLACKASTHFEYAIPCARRISAWALENAAPGLLLNVNVPDNGKPPEGEALTRLGTHHYRFEMARREDTQGGGAYYWLGVNLDYQHEPIGGTDCVAVYDNNHISITPLSLDGNDSRPTAGLETCLETQPGTRQKTPLETQPETLSETQ
jgi:5'-nucleotidase